jgi:aryl-alcohol dehydrogenase-like predicted oxidoreductase
MAHSMDLPLVRFGTTDLRVTRYCQGTAFRRLDRSAGDPRGQTVLRHCLDLGVNFFDSSNAYGWGGAEEALGKAIAGHRQEVVICTKVSPSAPPGPDGVSERLRFTRAFLLDQIEAGLRRLATDYVDLYLLHNPDGATPPQEIVAFMAEVVRSGKARYWGASNHSAAQVCEFVELSRGSAMAPFSGNELYYNIGARDLEDAVFPLLRRTGLGLLAFSPLAAEAAIADLGDRSYITLLGKFALRPGLRESWDVFLFPYRYDEVVAGRTVRDWIARLRRLGRTF